MDSGRVISPVSLDPNRTLVWIGAALGLGWAFLDVMAGVGGPGGDLIHLFDGVAAAVYAPMILSQHRVRVRALLGAVVLAGLGMTHMLWLLPAGAAWNAATGSTHDLWGLLGSTGLVYAACLGAASASWPAVLIMVAATGGALGFAAWVLPNESLGLGAGCAALHAGIVSALTFATFGSYSGAREDGRCVICGYDMSGNTTGTCPECGSPCPTARSH